jgi:hypothetical protein
MKRVLSILAPIALLAGAGFCAWRHVLARSRPASRVPVAPTDDLLAKRVLVSIRQAGPMPDQLRVRVQGGTVHLDGAVSAAERDRVLRATLAAPGIRGVSNRLSLAVESQPWEPSPRAQ